MRCLLVVVLAFLAAGPLQAQQADHRRYLSLQDVSWKQVGSNVEVTGQVASTAPRPMRGVQIAFQGYDEDGYPIVNAGTTVPYVPGGGSVEFQFTGGTPNRVARGQVDIVAGTMD